MQQTFTRVFFFSAEEKPMEVYRGGKPQTAYKKFIPTACLEKNAIDKKK